MEESILPILIEEIKKKKEFAGIPDKIVENYVKKNLFFIKTPIAKLSKHDRKILIKKVRAELHAFSGRFQSNVKKRVKFLEEGKIEALLKTHSSTYERIDFYPFLKELLKKLKVKSILDLGCGLNPIALADKDLFYYASDIDKEELKLIKNFFKKYHIKGKTFFYDLKNPEKEFPETDICLLFKVLDVIENRGHKLAEKLIKKIPSKYILVSFSTKTLSGKPMNHPQRGWIEQLLKRLGFQFEIIKSQKEIFYLIKK